MEAVDPDLISDKLEMQGNKAYEKFIDFNSEPVVFSDTAIKINMWGIKQERILLMTTHSIFNFKK
jgi:hypothetical protein